MLGYDSLTPYYAAVNRAEWGREVVINPYFSLIKIAGNFLEMELPANIDAVYYDAFAPEKQPARLRDRRHQPSAAHYRLKPG